MKRHWTRVLIGGALGAAVGCAHTASSKPPVATVDPTQLTAAYREVREGVKPKVDVGPYLFCSTRDGLEVALPGGDEASGYADKFRDRELQSDATVALRKDPRLAGQDIHAKAYQGEVNLTGHVASDELAVRAVQDVVRIPGVIDVNVALTSPESPGPVARAENRIDLDCPL